MTSDVYSNFKVAHHKRRLEHLKKGRIIIPSLVQWDISNRCNMDCNFCFYKIFSLSDWDPNAIMPTDICFKVIEELKAMGVEALEMTGGGSVETHPDYKKILREAKRYFQMSLVTNGTLLDDEALEIIKDFEWVRFSIDAVTSETFRKVKGVDLFDKAIDNLEKLLEIKDPKNIIGYSFVVCRENYSEIYEAAKFAKEIGCDNIRFSLAMTPQKDRLFDGIWDECVNQMDMSKGLEDENFKVFEFKNRIQELASEVLSDHCYYTDFVGVISPTGVYPCCRLKDDGNFNFGKIGDKTFKEIWFSDTRRKFLDNVRNNGCNFDCWMTRKNAIISYLLEENPRHVNFI